MKVMRLKFCLTAALLFAGWLPTTLLASTTLYVSPTGSDDAAAGTAEKPMSLRGAILRASATNSISEIIVAGGEYKIEYEGAVYIVNPPQGIDKATLPPLTIRAADGQKPVLHASIGISQSEPVPGLANVYVTQLKAALRWDPQIWERDTRVRYTPLSNKDSVAAHAGTCFYDNVDNRIYFRTSDDKPPAAHKIELAQSNTIMFFILRPNVILDGLSFRDFCNGTVIDTRADNGTIRNCHFDNCLQGWVSFTSTKNGVMENCTGVDVAQPVISYGDQVTVRGCRFEKARDRFRMPIFPQNDTAFEVYVPGVGGTFENNFAKGYYCGIWIKASGGPYLIRHNTIVDTHYGILWFSENSHSDTSYNVIVKAHDFISVDHFEEGFTLDYNLFWEPQSLTAMELRNTVMRGANHGKFNLVADPRFADPTSGDYRVLPDSLAVTALKDKDGKPAGAFGIAPVEAATKARPSLSLAFKSDTQRGGRFGEYTFFSDPWNPGGGVSTLIRELREPGALPERIASSPKADVEVRAFDSIGSVTKMRVTVGESAPTEVPYQFAHAIKLPDKDGSYRVKFEVQNDRSVWSEPAEAIIRLERSAPRLVGKPTIRASDHGLIVCFKTDIPCFASLKYGATPDYGQTVNTPKLIKRQWDPNDGGEWIETWNIPRTEFALPILKPNVATGATVHFKIELLGESNLSWTSPDTTAKVKGSVQTLYVSTAGENGIGRGNKERPYKTLQYAVDRALAGDRVVLLPGVYTEYTMVSHGGLDEKTPLTIEAEQPNTVTLDSAKREPSLIALDNVQHVTIRNLRIVYFQRTGINNYRSPHTTIDHCVFYNGTGWVTGNSVFSFYSPYCTITHTLAVGGEGGFQFILSPYATVKHNTCSQQMYAATSYTWSAKGSVQLNNSFCFAGNSVYEVMIQNAEDKTFRSDYNNLGTDITTINASYELGEPELWKRMKAEEFKTGYPLAMFRVNSKSVVNGVKTLKDWQEQSGQDKHSIFADPLYVNPLPPLDRSDWHVKPTSPNLKAGENGGLIGALGE